MTEKSKGIVNIHGREYKTVALRVAEFRAAYKIDDGWKIKTSFYSNEGDTVVVIAEIEHPEHGVIATGMAEEKRTRSGVNSTSALENCETSAIGRALSAAGFGGDEYASANEVQTALVQQGEAPQDTQEEEPGEEFTEDEGFAQIVHGLSKKYDKLVSEWQPDKKHRETALLKYVEHLANSGDYDFRGIMTPKDVAKLGAEVKKNIARIVKDREPPTKKEGK